MSEKFETNNIANIGYILDIIHDQWFSPNDITFNNDSCILSIKFKREIYEKRQVVKRQFFSKRIKIPVVEYVLRVHNVEKYLIEDTEQVGFYDFNTILYEPNLKCVTIKTCVPIKIQAYVIDFHISLEGSDSITGEVYRTMIGFFPFYLEKLW